MRVCVVPGCGRKTEAPRCRVHQPPVTLVCGPPASGKSTYVEQNKKPGDIVFDFDTVMRAICCDDSGVRAPGTITIVVAMRNAFIRVVRDQTYHEPFRGSVWIIIGAPRRGDRDSLREMLNAKVVLLDVEKEECIRREKARPDKRSLSAIEDYFRSFEH